jgi:DNA repair exonuclease SbcCD ATPase subunit
MRLKRIELKNFKRLVDFQAQFSPGVNVVKGPLNEMGKSTLLEGIIVALFHNPRSTAKELKDYVSWGSTKQCQTILEFENEENRYLLEKDFDKGTVRLIDENTREELDTFKEISGKMAELLGTNSDGLFTCTSCIRQAQVSEISSGKKEISESLEEVITGGEEGTLASQVIQKLDDKISEIRKGLDRPAKIKGSLASLRDQRGEYLRKYDEVRSEVSRVETQKIELVEVNKQLAQVKEEYEKSKAWLEKNKQCKETEASIKELEQKYDEVEKLLGGINELMTRLERANEALRSIEGFEDEPQVSEFRKGLDAIQNRRVDIEKDLAQREKELAGAKEKLDKRKSVGFLSSGRGIATALTILIGGIIGTLVGPFYLLGLIILGAVLLVITIIRTRTALVQDKTRISGIDKRIEEMKEALGKLGKEEQELLGELKCNTVGEFDKKERDFKIWLEEKRSLGNQLKGMLRGKTIEDFQKQKREIARDLAVKRAELTEDLIETRLNPEKYIELERKVRSLEAKQTELEKQNRRCEIIIEQARFNIEDQIRLEEELESLEEALKQEEKKVKVYGLARGFVSKAKDEALSSITDILREKIQEYFEIFTNGKYKQVEVKKDNKDNLEFWIYSDEKGGLARPEELSGGVIDEFYLACRLALAELIFGDKKSPLILDDPFVNFDPVRLSDTLNFFKTLASDYQIIIFTLSDLYDKVADNIILLGEKERPV